MAKTAVRNPKQIAQIAFTVDKNGKPRAYRVSLRQMRYFPIGYDEAELMVSTGQAEKVPYRPFGAKASKPNPKVPIVDLTRRVVSSGKLAGSGFRKKEVDPTEVEKEWKRVAVVHALNAYGEPVQRMLRSEFETAFWRGAARGLMNPVPKVTDRALRYRANANPPKGPKRCLFCGSTRNVEVGHLDGHEENNDRSNLAWNCRSCNTTLGAAFKKLGIGRRTRQYNPETGAQSVGQWVQALQSLRGEAGAVMEPAAALEMVRATPADKRSEFASQIWRTRRSRYGATGRQNPDENLTAIRADYPGVELDVHENADAITLNLVRVPAAQRGKGTATAIMKRLLAYADSKLIPIVLTPSSDFGSSKLKLEKWYKSLGFVPNAGRHKDFRFRETMIRLPRPGKRNPEGPAAELYEKFHGKASERIDIVEEEIHYHEHLTALGDLVELKIKTPTRIRATLRFPDEGAPTLASSEDGRQLFVVGGDQKVNLRDIEMDSAQWRRDMMDLGELLEVTYHTVKGFHKFEPTNYFHKLGEETSVKPRILYDTRNERLLVAGGQYAVKPEGIVN